MVAFVFLINYLVLCINGLYEDQIGSFDWRQQYLGKAKFSLIDQDKQSLKAYFFGSFSNAIGAVNSRDGSINWRHVLEEGGYITDMVLCADRVISISGRGSATVRAWNTESGFVIWEKPLYEGSQQGTSSWCDSRNGVLYISTPTNIMAINVQNGHSFASVTPRYATIPKETILVGAQSEYHTFGFVVGYHDEGVTPTFSIVHVNSSNETPKFVQTSELLNFHVNSSLNGLSDCLILHSSVPLLSKVHFVLVCLSSFKNGTSALYVTDPPTDIRNADSPIHRTVHLSQVSPRITHLDERSILVSDRLGSAAVYAVDDGGSLVHSYSLNKATLGCVGRINGEKFLFTVFQETNQPFKNLQVTVYDFVSGRLSTSLPPRQWTLASHHGFVESISVMMFVNSTGSVSFRLLVHTEDHAIQVIQQSGNQLWVREEALADIVTVEFVDLPVSESQARMEEEFGHTNNNFFDMFFKRCRTQLVQLVSFLSYWAQELPSVLTSLVSPRPRVQGDRRSQPNINTPAASLIHSHPGRLQLFMEGRAADTPETADRWDEAEANVQAYYANLNRPLGQEFLTRDTFNLHKILVLVTGAGKVFGLESQRGLIVWEYLVPSASRLADGKFSLFQQRNTAHFPLPPVMTLLFRSKDGNLPNLFSFNPITGVPSLQATLQAEDKNSDGTSGIFYYLSVDIIQAFLYPSTVGESMRFLRPIIMLDTHQQVHIYSPNEAATAGVVASGSRTGFTSPLPLYVYTVEHELARLTGYRVGPVLTNHTASGSLSNKATLVWRMRLHDDNATTTTRIVAAATRPASEHVYSVGRVLGDRSVLYKYLNPNLVAILTASGQPSDQTSVITVYLIDVVAGRIVYSASHRRCSQPVTLVHSENWIVYSCYKQQSFRNEVIVLELFEPTTDADGSGEPCAAYSVPGPLSLFLRNMFPNLLPLFTGAGFGVAEPSTDNSHGHVLSDHTETGQTPLPGPIAGQSIFSSLYRATEAGTKEDSICRSTGSNIPLVPRILQQAYILSTPPRNKVSAVSLTERGITSKSIIIGLEKGALIELPKQFFDPRRTMDTTPELAEEGLPPYAPVLPLSDQAVITYNQSVLGLRAVVTAVTGLESTSVVFAYGLDLFFTRIAPSQTYDLLKEDFDYVAIATVTVGMVIASVVTQRLATRRTVLRAWT